MSQCVEPIVGKILAGWRYDISGLAAEMRGDYEAHFADCEHCRSRQQIHRIIDISLIVLASVSAAMFLIGFWGDPLFRAAACILAGSGRAGGFRLVRADLAGGGGRDAGAHGRSRCGPPGGATRA